MRLYHYTTIDSLAQILKHRTLRFNRLDRVDDIEEGAISPAGVHIGQYVFVSCWTKEDEESIPLWKMYTANGRGVRISLDSHMFHCFENSDFVDCGGIRFSLKGSAYERTYTPFKDFINDDYLVFPVGEHELDFILKDIQYVDNVTEAVASSVFFQQLTADYRTVTFSTKDLGLFKHKRWVFEKESRFVLLILPGKRFNNIHTFGKELSQWVLDVMSNNIPNSISHYDMQLDPTALNSSEILLSPNCNESDRIIVESLCAKYAPKAIISNSNLSDYLRLK